MSRHWKRKYLREFFAIGNEKYASVRSIEVIQVPGEMSGRIEGKCSILKWIFPKCKFKPFRLIIGRNLPFFFGRRKIFEMNWSSQGETWITAPLVINVSTSLSTNSISSVEK